jgi:hypothetical protein
MLLGQMTQDGFIRVWTISLDIGTREAIKGITITGFGSI